MNESSKVQREKLLGYPINVDGIGENVRLARGLLRSRDRCATVACANPHSIVVAGKDAEFADALRKADILLPDGWGVVWAARWLGMTVDTRVSGYEFFSEFSRLADEEQEIRYFFLGSTPDVLHRMEARMAREFPRIRVVGTFSPPFTAEFSEAQSEEMIQAINRAWPDVLWVGMTAPKQEKWLQRNRDRLDVSLAVAVGAVFDFYAGLKSRGPTWMQRVALEWLARLCQDPRRLWRRTVLSAPRFFWAVARARWGMGRQG